MTSGDDLRQAENIGRPVIKRRAKREAGDQQENELAGVHVAEQPQRQGQRPHPLLDDAQDEIDRRERHRPDAMGVKRRREPFLEEQPDALVLDSDLLDQQEDPNRHADGRVHVRGRNGA